MAPAETTCCCPLSTGSKIVASIFIVASSLYGILVLIYLVRVLQFEAYGDLYFHSTTEYKISLAASIIIIIVCAIYIALGALLIVATNNRDYAKAKAWLICTGILFGLRLIFLFLLLINPARAAYLLPILSELGALIFHVYAFWVIVRLMQELKNGTSGSVDEHIRIGPA